MEASTQPLPPPSSQAPAQAQAKAQPQAQSQQDPACNFCRVKKIKCDRKLPRCAHCKRNDLECSYSDKGKRVSQTSIVLNSLDAIQSRLGLIEGVLSTVAESLAKPEPQSDTWSVDSFDYTDYLPDVDDFDRDRFASQNPVVPTQPQIPNTCEWQDLSKLHGPGLLLSFGFQAYFVLAKHLAQNFHPNTAAQAEARENFSKYQDALYQSILRSMSSFEGLNIWHDDQLVALPPRALVDDVYDTFFTELNPIIPLFRPDSFRSLIAQVYATSTEVRDTASVVCINNVILETLIVKTKFRNPGSSVNSLDVGMSDLYALLLKNARRALAATKDFTSPRLINVQALLSLCIIAHESFEVGVAELMLEQACQLARMMGLNRKRQVPPEPSPTDYDEQRKVFWSLFIVDKQISFLMGNSCRLPSYDCDVPFPEDEHFQRHIVPRIRLARIQEQVYVDLYSAQAQGRSSADLHRRISKIRKSLDRWYKAHEEFFKGAIPEQELETSANAHMWLALNFNYYNTRIMVCRLATDEESRKLRLDDARMGLKIVFSARKLIGTNTGSALLRGLITFFPFVEYFEIFKDVVAYPSPTTAAENLTLLRGVVEILQDLCDNSTITSSYTAQLLLIASKHLDLASRYIEFANMNDSTNESLTRRSTHSSSDWSPLPNLLTQNQLDFQEFGANLFGAGNASLSTDDTNMSTDHAMGGAMQAWSSFDGRNGPFSNESIPVSTDLFNNDSAALSAFPSTSSMNSYLRFRCSRPAVVAPESDLGPRHDIDLDLGSFRSELTQDFVTPWQTINKGRL